MTSREHGSRQPSKKRVRPTPSVELHYQKDKFDVDAWLGKYTERAVDREVHALADTAPAQADRKPPSGESRESSENSGPSAPK